LLLAALVAFVYAFLIFILFRSPAGQLVASITALVISSAILLFLRFRKGHVQPRLVLVLSAIIGASLVSSTFSAAEELPLPDAARGGIAWGVLAFMVWFVFTVPSRRRS
jgi:hypothetical protein